MPPVTRAASFTRNVLGDRLADMSRGLRAARSPAENTGLPRLDLPAAQPYREPDDPDGGLAGAVRIGAGTAAWILGADPYGRLVARHAPTGATYLIAEPPAPPDTNEPGPDGSGPFRTVPDGPEQFPVGIERIWPVPDGSEQPRTVPYGPEQEA